MIPAHRRPSTALIALVMLGASQAALAQSDALDRLRTFSTTLESFTANFEQTLYNADSEAVSTTRGEVLLKRPGRFVWRYLEPADQEIIADGERVWLYDKELDQVTVNPLGDRVSGTPLVLLMGTAPLDDEFELVALGEETGIDWIELTPREESADFESLYVGLVGEDLAAMELRDNFGQATQIIFSNFESGVPLDDALFEFTPPTGVDVIGQ